MISPFFARIEHKKNLYFNKISHLFTAQPRHRARSRNRDLIWKKADYSHKIDENLQSTTPNDASFHSILNFYLTSVNISVPSLARPGLPHRRRYPRKKSHQLPELRLEKLCIHSEAREQARKAPPSSSRRKENSIHFNIFDFSLLMYKNIIKFPIMCIVCLSEFNSIWSPSPESKQKVPDAMKSFFLCEGSYRYRGRKHVSEAVQKVECLIFGILRG